MFHIPKDKLFGVAAVLSIAAGIAYNSWPLGYWLNPAISRSGGLASELEALSQPFNWFFIACDVLCGVLVVIAVWLLWRQKQERLRTFALVSFALFGLLTITDALLPMTCEPSLTTCPSLSHQPVLILHGVASISAAVFLFVSAVLVWYKQRRRRGATIMSILMVGWSLFGLASLYFFFTPGPGYISQDYYLSLCGVWMGVFPFMLRQRSAIIDLKLPR